MVQAWYMEITNETDFRQPNKTNPPRHVTLEELYEKTGMECISIDANSWQTNQEYANLKVERGVTSEDVVELSRVKLDNFEERMKRFFVEHIHTDPEIRYVEAGSGYFDVRDRDEKWIRIWIQQNDLIILPAGIYHRFTLDTINDHIKLQRLFLGNPAWEAINRPEADAHHVRKQYAMKMAPAY
ncbi:1,2-dihydroxy-3-keto-5-methylthiopentene dioxygenase [Aplysia californica]|uniref:Acireductone dioxygenase n=1 Tax=Aplysia californica TaxID=6500 RepID=A0ABM0JYJ4_APLCA|nr:1,2-dihydroxy-3-keto-5-methylthiopentene dioxygenase [Aplysia californica]